MYLKLDVINSIQSLFQTILIKAGHGIFGYRFCCNGTWAVDFSPVLLNLGQRGLQFWRLRY